MRYFNGLFLLICLPSLISAQPDDYQVLWQCSGQSDTSEFGNELVSAGDQNLDGYDDILVTAWQEHRVYLYYGGNPMDTIPDIIFTYPGTHKYLPKECRDLNSDGIPDIVIGGETTTGACVYLYFGGPYLNNQYDMIFIPPTTGSQGAYGRYISMGDINGDGDYDLVVGAPTWSQGGTDGRIFVYYGGADIDTTLDFSITGTWGNFTAVGRKLSCNGDVNNDGYDDIFTYGVRPTCSDGVLLFYGGFPPDTIPDWENQAPWGAYDYVDIDIIPDINNDNFDDIVYADVFNNIGYLYYGNTIIPDTIADVTFLGNSSGEWTNRCSNIGDINNDGYTDYAIGSGSDGSICVYFLGPELGNIKNYDLLIIGEGVGGGAIASAGDVNGDGVTEMMYGISMHNQIDRGTVCIYGNPELGVDSPVSQDKPSSFMLHPCYPNPFNQRTVVSFELKVLNPVTLTVYNIRGREISKFEIRNPKLGENEFIWNAEGLSSGTYIIELKQGAVEQSVKAQLVK